MGPEGRWGGQVPVQGRRVGAGLAVILVTLGVVIGCGDTAPAGPTPTALPPALQAGQRVFMRYCNVCHPGGHQGSGRNLVNNPIPDAQIVDTVRHGDHAMPAFDTARISDPDLQSLIAYIRTLK